MNKKKIVNKSKKIVKKQIKRNPVRTVVVGLLLLIVISLGVIYLYVNGYLDDFLNTNRPIKYELVHEQNELGYYYYTNLGFEENGYYESTQDLIGDDLMNELSVIINTNFNPVSYGDARYILSFSDRNPNDNNNSVRGIYDNDVISTTWIGQGAGAWQREHVWPNSKLGIPRVNNSSKNQGSDLHNLRAITGINQTRSNRYFTNGSGAAVTVGTEAFYPGDDHKGDVARILLYMFLKYDFLELTDNIDFLINDEATNYKPEGAYGGLFSVLLEWHREDPVDLFEQQRNNYIYSEVTIDPNGREIQPQGNRNPFIDRPDFVHLIWEDYEISDLTKSEGVSNDLEIPLINENNLFVLFYEERRFLS